MKSFSDRPGEDSQGVDDMTSTRNLCSVTAGLDGTVGDSQNNCLVGVLGVLGVIGEIALNDPLQLS